MTMLLASGDYDAFYEVVRAEMPRITRDLFPRVLADLERDGVITITVTDTDISVRMPEVPETGVYRVERKRRLH